MADLTRADVVQQVIAQAAAARSERLLTVYALHVGGLNARDDADFVRAMNAADVVYADGGSVVLLARLAGATRIERAPTTDVGWDVLRGLSTALGRPARLALIGGPPGLAEKAAEQLESGGAGTPVFVEHGYHTDWAQVCSRLRAVQPDACIVGMGAPQEMLWTERWREQLPPGLLLTCGGWFGHIVGEERRAPRVLRRSGLEWIARMAQDPRRLGPRYARGIAATAALVPAAMTHRRGAGRDQPDSADGS